MKRLLKAITILACSILFSGTALAVNPFPPAIGYMPVTLTVIASCQITSIGALDFGSVPLNAPGLVSFAGGTTLTVNCAAGVPYEVTLDAGANFANNHRQMVAANGAYYLPYELYKPDGTTVWGDSDKNNSYPNGSGFSDVGDGQDQPITVNAALVLPITQPIAPGTVMFDTVTVIVWY